MVVTFAVDGGTTTRPSTRSRSQAPTSSGCATSTRIRWSPCSPTSTPTIGTSCGGLRRRLGGETGGPAADGGAVEAAGRSLLAVPARSADGSRAGGDGRAVVGLYRDDKDSLAQSSRRRRARGTVRACRATAARTATAGKDRSPPPAPRVRSSGASRPVRSWPPASEPGTRCSAGSRPGVPRSAASPACAARLPGNRVTSSTARRQYQVMAPEETRSHPPELVLE